MSSLHWDPEAGKQKIVAKLTDHIETTVLAVAERAQALAPVGTRERKGEGRGHAVELITATEARKTPGFARERARLSTENIGNLPTSQFKKINPALFRFKDKAARARLGAPASLGIGKRGVVTGFDSSHKPGTLKESIHPVDVVTEGTKIIGAVRAEAPYAAAVEFGYHGAGSHHTSSHGERPFMRQALEEHRSSFNAGPKG